MSHKRFSIIVADRTSGVTHRWTVPAAPALCLLALVPAIVVALVASMDWQESTGQLRLEHARLELENASYRAVTSDVGNQVTALKATIDELQGRVDMDPSMLQSMDQLPDSERPGAWLTETGSTVQMRTFEKLREILSALDGRLALVRRGVAYREALAEATPVIWPVEGWVSGRYGYRADPFTGERDFHPAVDISTQDGQPVYATATGRVFSAGRNGAYGNLVEIDHGFDLITRYGHLAEFAVDVGDTVQRGDLIGHAGATGRATGIHVHYEIWSGGRTINPMELLGQTRVATAN